jgi:hypothetical protein
MGTGKQSMGFYFLLLHTRTNCMGFYFLLLHTRTNSMGFYFLLLHTRTNSMEFYFLLLHTRTNSMGFYFLLLHTRTISEVAMGTIKYPLVSLVLEHKIQTVRGINKLPFLPSPSQQECTGAL